MLLIKNEYIIQISIISIIYTLNFNFANLDSQK